MTKKRRRTTELVDVRTIFPSESADFTPWLAEHLSRLADDLCLEITLVAQEEQVGDFRLDILARGERGAIVIENQLERTDHKHLGQLLTYASRHSARVLIWVTSEFREEHRDAIDWLNRSTYKDVEIYGVEVLAVRRGAQKAAVEFRPVALPAGNETLRKPELDEIVGKFRASRRPVTDPIPARCRQFFQPLVDELWEVGFTTKRNATAKCEQKFPSGYDGITYDVAFLKSGATGYPHASAYLWIALSDDATGDAIFALLQHRFAADIERQFDGSRFFWQPRKGRQSPHFGVYIDGWIDDPDERSRAIRAEMFRSLLALRRAVDAPLAKAMKELG